LLKLESSLRSAVMRSSGERLCGSFSLVDEQNQLPLGRSNSEENSGRNRDDWIDYQPNLIEHTATSMLPLTMAGCCRLPSTGQSAAKRNPRRGRRGVAPLRQASVRAPCKLRANASVINGLIMLNVSYAQVDWLRCHSDSIRSRMRPKQS
jgi:hypothetical protein